MTAVKNEARQAHARKDSLHLPIIALISVKITRKSWNLTLNAGDPTLVSPTKTCNEVRVYSVFRQDNIDRGPHGKYEGPGSPGFPIVNGPPNFVN